MILFGERPEEGKAAFNALAKSHVDALEKKAAEHPPVYPGVNAHLGEKSNEIWRKYKKHFFSAQHRKCGYCEAKITGYYGDVEHYRPKKAVWYLKSPGREVENSTKVRGRTFDKRYKSGYWWLAYDWDNYVLACAICNQRWKVSLFPVERRRTREVRKGDENMEGPLLLDPFGDHDPAAHLAFDDLGQIQALVNSKIGRKTIETCGLDRESLRDSRHEKARKAHGLIRNLAREENPDKQKEILEDIWELGQIQFTHAGMVRAIFQQNVGLHWSELDAFFDG